MKAATATRTTLGRPRQDRGTAIRTWSDPERTRRDAIGHSIGLKLLPTLITSPGMSAGRGQRRTINLRTAAAGAPHFGASTNPHDACPVGSATATPPGGGAVTVNARLHDDVGIRQQLVAWHRCVHLGATGTDLVEEHGACLPRARDGRSALRGPTPPASRLVMPGQLEVRDRGRAPPHPDRCNRGAARVSRHVPGCHDGPARGGADGCLNPPVHRLDRRAARRCRRAEYRCRPPGKSGAPGTGRPRRPAYVVKHLDLGEDWTMRAADRPRRTTVRCGGAASSPRCRTASTSPSSPWPRLRRPDGHRPADARRRRVAGPRQRRAGAARAARRFLDHMAALHARSGSRRIDVVPPPDRYLSCPVDGRSRSGRGSDPGAPARRPGLAAARGGPPALARVVVPLAHDPAPARRRPRDDPSTFVHGNWKLGNLGTDDDGRTVLIDWESPGRAPRLSDLAWYLAINCRRLPTSKEDAIAAYREALERRGIDTDGGGTASSACACSARWSSSAGRRRWAATTTSSPGGRSRPYARSRCCERPRGSVRRVGRRLARRPGARLRTPRRCLARPRSSRRARRHGARCRGRHRCRLARRPATGCPARSRPTSPPACCGETPA